MKRLLSPAFTHIPMLIEYLSTEEEESEIDLYQARKVTLGNNCIADTIVFKTKRNETKLILR